MNVCLNECSLLQICFNLKVLGPIFTSVSDVGAKEGADSSWMSAKELGEV